MDSGLRPSAAPGMTVGRAHRLHLPGSPLACRAGPPETQSQRGCMAAATSAAAAAGATAVSLADVSVTFRLADGGADTAVERATLEVADGEFVAIVGPTGC